MSNKVAKSNTTVPSHRGRKKGTLNRKSEHIFEICDKMGFDPILTMVYFAMGDYEALGFDEKYTERQGFQGVMTKELTISPELMKEAAKDLLQFMYPKRKSVEFPDVDGSAIKPIVLAYSEESLKKAANEEKEG